MIRRLVSLALAAALWEPASAAWPTLDYSGKLAPSAMVGLESQRVFNLPFRLVESEVSWGQAFWELKANLAVEMRWRGAERYQPKLDVREFYLSFYPAFGEIRIGRQIQAWGVVDGNNPTDNLNPYDYYYLFDPGAGRKLGILSLSVDYSGDLWRIYATFLGEHRPARRPTAEDDFPSLAPPLPFPLPPAIHIPEDLSNGPADSQLVAPSVPYGGGIRLLRSLPFGDVSVSYLNAVDPLFSPYHKTLLVVQNIPGLPMAFEFPDKFGYRRTQVWGADGVVFWRDFTLRQEGAWFHTATDPQANIQLTADYSQYVVQLEYETPWDITLMGQYIYQHVWKKSDTSDPLPVDSSFILFRHDFSSDFRPGMGTPYALLGDKVLLLNTKATLYDNTLELRFTALKNLDAKGVMTAIDCQYSPQDAFKTELGWVYFWAPANEPQNIFSRLRSFAHLQLGLTYFF